MCANNNSFIEGKFILLWNELYDLPNLLSVKEYTLIGALLVELVNSSNLIEFKLKIELFSNEGQINSAYKSPIAFFKFGDTSELSKTDLI